MNIKDKIPDGWEVFSFGNKELVNIIDGDRGKNYPKEKDFFDEGYCLFLNTKNVTNRGFNFNTNKYITKEKDNSLRSGKLNRYDIVMTTRGTIGNCGFYDDFVKYDNIRINSGMVIFRVISDKIFQKYLYMFLTSNIMREQILSCTTGTAQPQLPIWTINKLYFFLPPLSEQKRIASILSALDDKIELNNKTNKILEEMAQTIFKEWFINFNFPNEDGKPYKKSGGEMIDSELGKIPKGWKVGTIGDLISNLFNGDWGKDKNKEKYTKEVICIRGADIGDIFKGFDGNPVRRFILEKNLKSKKLLEGDIVMECSGGSPTQSTGRCIFVTKSLLSAYDKPLICTNFCKVIKIKEKEYRGYAYNLLWYLYNTRLFFLFENGTTGIKNLDVNNLFKRHMIAIPDIDVALEYNEIFLSLIDIMHANKKENEKLSNIRDSLLPKLMTPKGRRADGEIRV